MTGQKNLIQLTLTKEGWENEIRISSLKPRTQRLIIAAVWARKARKKISGYPQTTPEQFEEILTREIDTITLDGKILSLEMVIDRNNRHLSLQWQNPPKRSQPAKLKK